jgi:hypothetical protein
MLNIVRNVSILALLAAGGLAGCTEQSSSTAATRLQQKLDDANTRIATWQHDGSIVTRQMQQEIVAPVMAANDAYRLELRDEAALDSIDSDTVAGIATGWRQLGATLGVQLAGYAELGTLEVEEAACTCEVDGECDADPVDPVPPIVDPTTTTTTDTATPAPFKSTCRVAAGVANAGCIALCWKKCLLSLKKRKICIAACEAIIATALEACSELEEPYSN